MAKKLKNLKIKKVDFVTAGANPEAHINLFKAKKNTEPIEKKAESFDDGLRRETRDKVCRQIWNYAETFAESFISVIFDDEAENKNELMSKSLDEFYGAVGLSMEAWSEIRESDYRPEEVKSQAEAEALVKKLKREGTDDDVTKTSEIKEGVEDDMTLEDIDKSKLTDEEKNQLESIIKKAGGEKAAPEDDNGAKEKTAEKKVSPTAEKTQEDEGDVYKGLNPVVKQELDELKKFRDNMETKELTEIAKKYEIIGKKPEELVPVLKSLKAAGGTAFNDMISILDASVATVEKSGAFEEVGKSGHISDGSSTVAKAKALADEIKKNRPETSDAQAMAQVWEAHPELMEEYDNEIGG